MAKLYRYSFICLAPGDPTRTFRGSVPPPPSGPNIPQYFWLSHDCIHLSHRDNVSTYLPGSICLEIFSFKKFRWQHIRPCGIGELGISLIGVCKGGSWNPKIPISNGVKSQIPISNGVKSQFQMGSNPNFKWSFMSPFPVYPTYLVFRIRILKQNLNWDIRAPSGTPFFHFQVTKSY